MDFASSVAALGATHPVRYAKSVWSTFASAGRGQGSEFRYSNNFDGLRLLAALLVLYGHQRQLVGSFDSSGTVGLRTLAFFAISGFLVAGSWQSDPCSPRFLLRRFLRVWPAYAVMVVLCAACAYAYAATNLHQLAAMFYLNNLYFRGFDWSFFRGPWPQMNMSIWTIPFEVYCYVLMALVGVFGKRMLMVAAAVVMAWAAARFGAGAPLSSAVGPLEWDSTWTLYFGGFFSAGVLLRLMSAEHLPAALLVSMLLGIPVIALGQRTTGLMLVIPAALVWIGLRSWPVLRSASRFGDLSLGIFLWAWPIQQVNLLWLGFHRPVWLELGVVLPQVLLAAWLSRHLIELPALRFKPKRRPMQTLPGWRASQFGQFVMGVRSRAF